MFLTCVLRDHACQGVVAKLRSLPSWARVGGVVPLVLCFNKNSLQVRTLNVEKGERLVPQTQRKVHRPLSNNSMNLRVCASVSAVVTSVRYCVRTVRPLSLSLENNLRINNSTPRKIFSVQSPQIFLFQFFFSQCGLIIVVGVPKANHDGPPFMFLLWPRMSQAPRFHCHFTIFK
jgi:hypothetical protein